MADQLPNPAPVHQGAPAHLAALTGLRFYAAIAVFLSHLSILADGWIQYPVPFGAASLSFFFVLSGFVLAYIYGQEGVEFSARKFFIKRVARIWPLHVCLAVLTFIVLMPDFFSRENGVIKAIMNLSLTQAWVPIKGWATSLNGVSWTLSADAFLYILFPLLLFGRLKQIGWKVVVIGMATVLMLLSIEWWVPVDGALARTNMIRFFPPLLLFEFSLGILFGLLFNRGFQYRSRSITVDSAVEAGLIASLIAFLFIAAGFGMYQIDEQTKHWALANYFLFYGTTPFVMAMVVVFSTSRGLIARLLSNRLSVFLGHCSFGFYIIHMFVFKSLMKHFNWMDNQWRFPMMVAGSFLLALSGGILLRFLIEEPCRKAIVSRFIKDKTDSQNESQAFEWAKIKNLINPKAAMLSLSLGIAGCLILNTVAYRIEKETGVAEILKTTPEQFRDVEFEGSGRLLGFSARGNEKGVEVTLVWDLQGGRKPKRFVHLCDQDNKVVRQGPANPMLERNISSPLEIVDRIQLTGRDLNGVRSIGIGFFDMADRTSAKVIGGPRSMGGYRLDLIAPSELVALRAQFVRARQAAIESGNLVR